MNRAWKIFRAWLPFAVVVTAFCALAYVTAQQVLRQGANDPQIRMAEDTAAALNRGTSTDIVVPGEKVEFSTSLAPFLVVYDSAGKPVAGSGVLDGKLPDYPLGALEASKQTGENRVTWQPAPGVRVASIVLPYMRGYVMAGRNMREVEAREGQAEALAAIAWVVTMVTVLVAVAIAVW